MEKYTKYGLITGIVLVIALLVVPMLDYFIGYVVGFLMGSMGAEYMPGWSRPLAYFIIVCFTTLIGFIIGKSKK